LDGVVIPENGTVSNTFELDEFPAPPVNVVATELNDDEVLITWNNPQFSMFEPYVADMGTGVPAGWTIDPAAMPTWYWTNDDQLGSKPCMFADSDAAGSVLMQVSMTTPVVEYTMGQPLLLLNFDQYFNTGWDPAAYGDVEVYDGNNWVVVLHQTSDQGSFTAPSHKSIDVTAYANPEFQVRFFYSANYDWYWAVNNVVVTNALTRTGEPVLANKPTTTRAMEGYIISRTTCETGELQFMGMVPATDSVFTDHTWGSAEPNVYKWGVIAVYETNDSEIAFSNCLDKNMETVVSVTVTTNSGDLATGTLVQFTNMSEPDLGLVYMTVLDETGYYAWDDFRLGDYDIFVEKPGFTPIEIVGEPIWAATDFAWLLEEEITPVGDLHVNPNGFATWTGSAGPPPPPPGPDVIVDETYDDYVAGGKLAEQAQAMGRMYWTTWSGALGGTEDATVSDAQSVSGSNSMLIEQNVDAVLLLDQYTSGVFNVNFDVYIPTGKLGYFNLLQFFDGTGATSWGTQTYFNAGGAGLTDAGGAGTGVFTYTYDTWHNVNTLVDLDADYAEMYFDGTFIVSWVWSGGAFGTNTLNEFHAMDFYGAAAADGTLFDNLLITKELETTAGARTLEYYKVWLDGIFVENVMDNFYQYDVTTLVQGQEYYSEVAAMYTNGMSEKMDYTWTYMPCDSFPGPANLAGALEDINNVYLTWGGTPVPPPPPVIVIIEETYDDYTAGGKLAEQAQAMGRDYWTTWSGAVGGAEDANVSDAQSVSGSNSMLIEQDVDAVLLFDAYTAGVFNVDFDVYIPAGKLGYFNLLQAFDGAASSWGTQTYFNADGAGLTDAGGAGTGVFTYTYDTWHHVHTMVDLDADYAEMYFNGNFIVSWVWSSGAFGTNTLNQFESMDFFGAAADDGTFYDNMMITMEPEVRMSANVGNAAELDLNAEPRSTGTSRAIWDVQYSFDIDGPSGLTGLAGGESDGEFIYATKWSSSSDIVKFTVDGTYVETFQIPGVSSVRDLAFDGTYMYGAAASTTVYQMDFTNKTLIGTINAPTAVRAIAYDEDNDAFWGNNFSSDLVLFDRSGATLNTITTPPSMYGAAYDNFTVGGPFLWVFTGTSTGGGCQIEQIDIATGNVTGVSHSVSDDFGAYIAGGLYITEDLVTGKRTIGGTAQGTPDLAFGYEMGDTGGGGGGGGGFDPGPVIGANVYRDGVLIAEMVQDTFYLDMALDYGMYEYCVNLLYEEMAESCTGSCVDVEVTEDCAAPEDLTAELEGDNLVHLLWDQYIPPTGEWIIYNDGTFENGFCSTAGGAGLAQVFTPTEYPCTVTEVRYFNDAYGSPGQENEVYVLTGDGATVLAGPYSVSGAAGASWVTVDIDDVTLASGTFMVYTANVLAGGPYVGVDDSFYDGSLYFGSTGAFTELGVYGYYYVGSHEAYVLYGELTANAVPNSTVLRPANATNSSSALAVSNHVSGEVDRPIDNTQTRSFIAYNIYKNGDLLEALWPDNYYDYDEMQIGDQCYTVTAEYSYCGESDHSNEACIDITVGIDEIGENEVSLYPNPASSRVNVTSIHEMTRLTVTNYVGQIVYRENVTGSTRVELNTSSYQAGVYLVKIETESGVVTKRVIIRR